MPIDVTCGACGRAIKAPDKLAGKKVKCPQCATVVAVPAAAPPAASHKTPPASPAAAARVAARPQSPPQPAAQRKPPSPPQQNPRQVFQNAPAPEPPPFAGVGDLLHEELSLEYQRRVAETDAEFERRQQEEIRYAYEAPKRAAEVLRSRGIHGQYAGARRLDVGFAIGRAWDLYRQHFGILLLATVIAFLLSLTLQGIVFAMGFGLALLVGVALTMIFNDPDVTQIAVAGVLYAFQLVNLAPTAYVWAGQLRFTLRLAKDEPPQLIELFKGGPHIIALLGGMITMMVIGLLPYLPVSLVQGLGLLLHFLDVEVPGAVLLGLLAVGGIATIVLWVITIRILFKRSLFPFVAVDLKTSGGDAMEISSRLISGSVGGMLLVYLTSFALVLLGILTCGIGLIFTAPLSQLVLTAAFVDLTGEMPRVRAQ